MTVTVRAQIQDHEMSTDPAIIAQRMPCMVVLDWVLGRRSLDAIAI